MRIVVAGGSGFLGSALIRALRDPQRGGHEVTVLTRRPHQAGDVAWDPTQATGAHPWRAAVAAADAVVNLAGESIDGGRWSPERKRSILESRVVATRAIVAAMRDAASTPPVLVNASAVGFYGPHGDEVVTEGTGAGSDFLASVCRAWEEEAGAAAAFTRVVLLRTGLVLAREGGALPRMALPFRLFAGGPLGSGRQYWPWIHIFDWVALARLAIESAPASGPINLTAPTPVTNREFTSTLGRVLHRPALLPAPAFALRLVLGEMADGLVLHGQRAVPARAEQLGFSFAFEQLEPALSDLYR